MGNNLQSKDKEIRDLIYMINKVGEDEISKTSYLQKLENEINDISDINHMDGGGDFYIDYAIDATNIKALNLILKNGAILNLYNGQKCSPLCRIFKLELNAKKSYSTTFLLIDHGVDFYTPCKKCGFNIVDYIILHIPLAELYSLPAEDNVMRNHFNYVLLCAAIQYGTSIKVKYLLDNNIKFDRTRFIIKNELLLAIEVGTRSNFVRTTLNGWFQIIELLLKKNVGLFYEIENDKLNNFKLIAENKSDPLSFYYNIVLKLLSKYKCINIFKILCTGFYKNPESPFYKDVFPFEMIKVIYSFID